MGLCKTTPVVVRAVEDTTPDGSIRRTARTADVVVDLEYDTLNAPLGEVGGLFGAFGNNMPRGRASLSQADLAAMRRQQRENYDMYTEDTRAQQRVAEARGVIREQRGILRGGWMGEEAMDYNYSAQQEAQRTLDTFRETGVNADRRATEREIAEANAAGRRRREEVEQGRMVRARVEGNVMGAVRR